MRVIIVTRIPDWSSSSLLKSLLESASKIYLVEDGVYLAIDSPFSRALLQSLLEKGVRVIVSRRDLETRGVSLEELLEGVRVKREVYPDIANDVLNGNTVVI